MSRRAASGRDPVAFVAAALRAAFADVREFAEAAPSWLTHPDALAVWGGGRPSLDAYLCGAAALGRDPLAPWHDDRGGVTVSGPVDLSFLGANLRTLRREAGLTQHQAASAAGINPTALSVVERGHSYGARRVPGAHVYVPLCRELAVDPRAFCRRLVVRETANVVPLAAGCRP